MRKILDYAFGNFTEEEIVEKGYQVKGQKTIPVTKGKENEVSIESKESISMVVKNGEKDQYKTVLKLDEDKLNEDGELTAPVKKGDKVGTLTIEPIEGEGLGFLTEAGQKQITVDVIATKDVEKANWFVLMMRGVGGFFGNLWDSATSAVKGIF
jgi:D-alanyl-D-alanine carboxypeptidase (penicillin-binding protein 5/6)